MKTLSLIILMYSVHNYTFSQNHFYASGKILDNKTKEPLAFANLILRSDASGTTSDERGEFRLVVPLNSENDSVIISYIGYETVHLLVTALRRTGTVYLEEVSTMLSPITISAKKINHEYLFKSFKLIQGDLYAQSTEVNNAEYSLFLKDLESSGNENEFNEFNYDLSRYEGATKAYYLRYHAQHPEKFHPPGKGSDKEEGNYSHFPVINISHEAAIAYCNWLTDEYNIQSGKKKFKKVKFRLPTLNEWQIAALGDPHFQSWTLDENIVTVPEPLDTLEEIARGKKKITMPVKTEVLYPWWGSHNYRKKAQNKRNCFLGNFKAPENCVPCLIPKQAGDGYPLTGHVGTYFPNGMGLYNVVGNVAEMIDEYGKACGGSWDQLPSESTIRSVSSYNKPSSTVGFRVFMEVIEN